MKNLHFCTPELISGIKNYSPTSNYDHITTYRTGFVPSLYSGNIINLNDRSTGKDIFLCKGRIEYVLPEEFQELPLKAFIEIDQTYRRKFHKKHWFFVIGIKPLEEGSE